MASQDVNVHNDNNTERIDGDRTTFRKKMIIGEHGDGISDNSRVGANFT